MTMRRIGMIVSSFAATWRRVKKGLVTRRFSLCSTKFFLHMLLSMIAGEVETFGEMMNDYKPAKSLPRRLFEFFVVEPLHDLWIELWYRITLARPTDLRILMDPLKIASAYTWGSVLLWCHGCNKNASGREESVHIGICRFAGNTLGCALGYLCRHNTKNFSEMRGCCFAFGFVLHICKNHPTYGVSFGYASITSVAGVATSVSSGRILTRVLGAGYSVASFMLICMFLFLNNPIKICNGYRTKLMKVVSEIIDDGSLAARYGVGRSGKGSCCCSDDTILSSTELQSVRGSNTCSFFACPALAHLNIKVSLLARLITL